MDKTSGFKTFETWAQLVDHIKAGYRLWYQAPLDHLPVLISAVLRKDGKIRVYPMISDPFTADAGHLSRFRGED